MKIDTNNAFELQKYKCNVVGTIPFNGSFVLSGASVYHNTNCKVTNVTDSPTKLFKFDIVNGEVFLTAKYLKSDFFTQFITEDKMPDNTFDNCINLSDDKKEISLTSSSLNDNSDGAFDFHNGKIIFHAANIILYELDENLELVKKIDYKDKIEDDDISEASEYGLQTVSASHGRRDEQTGTEINYVARIGVMNIVANMFSIVKNQYVQIFSRNLETFARTKIMDLQTVTGAMHECILLDHYYIIPVFAYNPNFFKAIFNPVFSSFTWMNRTYFYKCDLQKKTVRKYVLRQPFGCFHVVNYFHKDQDIIIDVVAWKKPVDMANIFSKIENINNKVYPPTMLVRVTLTDSGASSSEILHEFDGFVEGFCIDEKLRGKRYESFYSLKNLNEIIKIEIDIGVRITSLYKSENGFCSQPVFNADTIIFTSSNDAGSSLIGVDLHGLPAFNASIPLEFPITFTNHSAFVLNTI